ncbi:DUF1819 family protein [Luteimonas sp. A501]
MSPERYRLSFTTGGLFLQESVLVTSRYRELHDWKATRDEVRSGNLLQVRTAAASLRISKEIIARLEHLSEAELVRLLDGSERERAYLLWSAVCRRYAFIRDFATEVLREHYLTLRRELPLSEFNAFFHRKSAEQDAIESTAVSTQAKLRQNLYRMMREADLLSDQYVIQPAMLTPGLAKLLARQDQTDLNVFPLADTDIKRLLQ